MSPFRWTRSIVETADGENGMNVAGKFQIGAALLLCGVSVAWSGPTRLCLVCGAPDAKGSAEVQYRGGQYPVCAPDCAEAWLDADKGGSLDSFVAQTEPRGALFQGDSQFLNPTYQQANPMSRSWLFVGLLVMLAVVSAGLASSLALGSGRAAPVAFAMGFMLPGLGIGLSLMLPRRPGAFALRGVKIPSTREETCCPACGHPAHPSATRCPGCGEALTPTAESEVVRA